MDCYKSESEFIDSLDFLSPPLKRISSRDLFGCAYNGEPNNIQLFRGFRRKFAPKDKAVDEKEVKKATRTVKIGGASSTSLILKKTSERKILQRYTVVSYTSLQSSNLNTTSLGEPCTRLETKDKPLIKVTVIPKSDQVQTAKLLRRRRSVPKKIQSTSSNHENSIKTKNLYLVVAGRRNKIYEIKTTGSATCSSDQTDNNYSKHDISVEGFSNVKHLIQSLNMDQKQRNYKKELKIDELDKTTSPNIPNETSSYACKGIDPYECEEYTYSGNLEGGKRPLNRSRVRIYGQLGRTEDDRYVLRYGATVNDKPDFTQLTQDFLPQALPRSGCNTYDASPEVTKEVSVQATYGSCNRNQQHVVTGVIYSKESQATQVNFNISTDPRYCCRAMRVDKDIQCNCNPIAEDKLVGGKSEINALKEGQSPLVIISVYPKQNTEETYKYSSCAYRRPVTHTSANVQYVSKLQVDNSTDRKIVESKADERQNRHYTYVSKSQVDEGTNRKIVESKVDEVTKRRIIEPKPDEGQNKNYMYVSKSQVDEGTNRNTVESKGGEVTNRKIIESKADEGQNRNYAYVSKSQVDEGANKKMVESKIDEITNRKIIESKADEGQNRKYTYVAKSRHVDEATNRRIVESKVDEGQNRKYITPLKKYNKRPLGSRSPSPVKNTSKGNVPENQTETLVLKTQTDTAPDRYKTMRGTKNKTLEKDRGRSEASASSKVPITKPGQRSKSPMKRNPILRSEEKGTITDHAKAKKNLVENYTKQLTGQMNHRDKIPARLDNSKVTINIEGEQEYYNVLFDQSKLSTDLRVNKTMKNMNSQKSCNRDAIPTFEDLLIISNQNCDAQSTSITRDKNENDKQFDENSKNKRFSAMTIRDSIEISHRREDRHGCDVTSTRNCIPAHCIEDLSNNPQWLAPIKHYTGDDCSICDPVERDKQIRILLGVDKSKYFAPTSLQAHSSENGEYQCLYRRECEKRPVAELNLLKYCPILGSLSSKFGGESCCCNNALCKYGRNCGDKEPAVVIKQGNDKTISSSVQKEQRYVCKQQSQGVTGNNQSSAIYQQLILNRNIQMFLQVEQFSKQKPIILSRKQYDKVKKTIQTTLNHRCKCKEKHKNQDRDVSDISVGEVRQRRNKNIQLHFDQEIQTDWIWGKSSFQSKRPRMVSKVRYMVRAPRSKYHRERLQDKDADRDEGYAYEDADGLCQIYPQKERNEKLQICQGTCQTTITRPRHYDHYRPSEQYFETQRRRQCELPDAYSRNPKFDRSNELKKNKRECDYHIPNVTVDKKKNKEHGKHKPNENFCLHSGEQRKQKARHCKEQKEYAKAHEKKRSENGEHRKFINNCYNGNGECRKSDEISLNTQNKENFKEFKEQRNSNNNKSLKVTEQDRLNDECSKEYRDQERGQSIKNCIEGEAIYTAGHQSVNQENRAVSDNSKQSEPPNVQNIIEHAIANRIHHRECGDYNIESEEPRIMSLWYPQNEEHSLHTHQNSKTHKANRVKECHTTKREHYRASNTHAERVIEHNELFEERTQPLKRHEVLLRERLRHITMHNENVTVDNPCFEDVEYQKHNKESEHKVQETYSRLHAGVQDYFKPDFEGDEYFGQNLEYCRLDGEHHIQNKEHNKNNDKCSVNTKERSCHSEGHDNEIVKEEQLRAVTLYDAQRPDSLQADHTDQSTKKTVSSLEIHYTSVAYMKKIDMSSSDLAVLSDSSLCHVNSIQTIFRGRRKSPTPNLGTSIYSLYSENGLNSNKSAKFIMAPRDVKPNKRPFLRRLMSCLVMRSTRASDLKLPTPVAKEIPSVNSSVDSYHISTSLGAVEVSSSIYDTSASFYSNHTILPINSKIKRGFFNSVRGFLTNRRS